MELYCPARAELAEGPVWHDQALWWVNIIPGTLNRMDPSNRMIVSRVVGDFLGAAVPTRQDGIWLLALRDRLVYLDWTTGDLTFLAGNPDDEEGHRFNDGACDPAGRFYVGTLNMTGRKNACALYRLEGDALARVIAPVALSNGLAWSGDGTCMYYVDTGARALYAYNYDPADARIGEPRVVKQFSESEGAPDGIATDREGGCWVACWGGGQVLRLDGTTGQCTHRVALPVKQVSSVCFGGPGLDQLYITTAAQGYTAVQRLAEPLAGSLFVAEPGFEGTPCSPRN